MGPFWSPPRGTARARWSEMDTVRYVVAVLVWALLPPAIVYWLVIHPFVGFWRRLGKVLTLWIVALGFGAMIFVLFVVRDRFLVREFGTHWTLWVAAALFYMMSIAIERQCRKQLKLPTLVGVPEVDPDQSSRALLSEGIYAHVRHPRYVSVMSGMLAMALFTNYLTVWVLFAFAVIALYVIVRLEEHELVASLGATYQAYRERVPMFIPRKS